MGDVGGLFDGMRYIIGWLFGPFFTMKLKIDLLSGIFRSHNNQKFKRKFLFAGAKYRRLVRQADQIMSTKLDLRKFFKWMKYQKLAVATLSIYLLDWRQNFAIKNMTELKLKYSGRHLDKPKVYYGS